MLDRVDEDDNREKGHEDGDGKMARPDDTSSVAFQVKSTNNQDDDDENDNADDDAEDDMNDDEDISRYFFLLSLPITAYLRSACSL